MNFGTCNETCAAASEVVVIAVKPHLYSGALQLLQVRWL